jgi:hypothetical protein
VVEQQQQMMRMSSLLAAIETLAKQAVKNSAADPSLDDAIKAAEGNVDFPISRPSKGMRATDGVDDVSWCTLHANLLCPCGQVTGQRCRILKCFTVAMWPHCICPAQRLVML